MAGRKLAESDDACLLPDGSGGDWFNHRRNQRDGKSSVERCDTAASDIQEAKEILVEHYDNIEQKIDNIDHEIADLQAKRTAWCSNIRELMNKLKRMA
ncbi:hypothetical protein ACVXG9_03320 [Escherichia coli]